MVTSANAGLSRIYETEESVTKLALGGGVIGALFGAAAGKSVWEQQQANRREGIMMTNALRAELAQRNEPIYEGFRSGLLMHVHGPEFDPHGMDESIRLASAIGSDLAKEAGIGELASGVGKAFGSAFNAAKKTPFMKGMGSLASGGAKGVGNLMGGIGRGVQAAPGAVGSFMQNKATQLGGALKTTAQNTMQSAQNAWGGFKQNMQQRALTRQYGLQRAGQRLEGLLTRAGNRIEGALGGTPKAYTGPTTTIDPAARRAAAQTRLTRMKQNSAGRLQTPGTPKQLEPAGTPAANPNPAGPPPAEAPKATNPAPTAQPVQAPVQAPTQAEPQGQGVPYRAPAAQNPPPAHATPQQPSPPPQPAQPPKTGPSAQGAGPQPAAAPPPPPPSTPAAGQGQPAQPPPPTPQATPSQPTAATAQAGKEGPAVSPQQEAQNQLAQQGQQGGFDLQKMWDRTGLSNDRWKWKLPALAAAGASAYGLYRAGKGAFNWLGQEAHPEQWGNPYLQPAASVNEWGVPQR